MPRRPIIDMEEMQRMLDEGKSQREIATHFGVGESSVSKRKRKLQVTVVESTVGKRAKTAIKKGMDAVDQLHKINADANEMLDLLMAWQRGDKHALQVLEGQVRESKVRVGDQEEAVREYKFKDPRELAIRVMSEIRGQLTLQLEIFKTLYDIKAMQEFREEVLEAIGEAAPDVRTRIIERLNKRRALRGAVKYHQ